MSYNDLSQRSRGPSSGFKAGPNSRPTQETRNGGPPTPAMSMTRAEKFEDEKRRIIESCFGKREADGSISESYITHIRIIEDAAHPSSPPPIQSSPESKKHRVIVIAVRKSGRVRMHKARQNDSGSFSIGKTWVLDDLMAIESYTNPNPSTAEEQQNKERAGGVGFLVTIQKPYYWQAGTVKEKDFFIYSLIKIYKKYTGGKLPELHGFDPQELEQLVGPGPPADAPTPKSPPQSNQEDRRGPSQGAPHTQPNRPSNLQLSDRGLQGGREIRPRPSEEPPARERPPRSRPPPESLQPARSSQERVLQQTDSSDSIPQVPGSFPSSEFVRNLNPKNFQSDLRTRESQSPIRHGRHKDESGNHTVQQEPNLRKLAGAQSTESFRNRLEQQSSRNFTSGKANGERAQPSPVYPPVSSLETSHQPLPESLERNTIPTPLRTGATNNWPSSQTIKRERRPSNAESRLSSSQQTSNSGVSEEKPTLTSLQGLRADMSRKNSDLSTRSDHREQPSHRGSPKPPDVIRTAGATSSTHINGEHKMNEPHVTNDVSSKSPAKEDEKDDAEEPLPTEPINSSTETASEEESHRPGLGPMIKKKSNKEIANTILKAASAYSAFKPRAGGAAEKILNSEKKATDDHDGVSGVFPAPSATKGLGLEDVDTPTHERQPEPQNLLSPDPNEVPSLQITTRPTKPLEIITSTPPPVDPSPAEYPPEQDLPREEHRRKRRSDYSSKYSKTLGIDHSLLDGRTFEIDTLLNELGWNEETTRKNTFEGLQSGLRKEITRLEAGSWLGVLENGDERVAAVGHMMDKVIAECEELECLLTLYNAELGTLSEDVAYIEAQSQGLQVQTANQKILHTELKNLLDTISISTSELQLLRDASLSQIHGIKAVEATLSQLYTAMLMIDPQLRHNGTRANAADRTSIDASSITGLGGSTLSSMRAVREKKEGYGREGTDFVQRFKQYMSIRFRGVEVQITSVLEQRNGNSKPREPTRLDFRLREEARAGLWLYSPLMLFIREMKPLDWNDLMRMYQSSAKKPYQDEIQDHLSVWKAITRKPLGEEDCLFTTPEKDSESIVGRKLTVKRAKTVRSDGTSRISTGGKLQDGKVNAYEAFAGALSETARMILVEQNFLVDYFHLSSLENLDFVDAIATPPEVRKGGNPTEKKTFDPDRNMAKKVLGMMEEIFYFWPTELQNLVDWVTKQEILQGVGLLLSLESQLFELEETNQEFLVQTMTKIHDRLATVFGRFVDDQMRGIEETKIKIKKRKGVISFMRTFPEFSAVIESILLPVPGYENPPVRSLVNNAYQKLNKAMFESLKFIAKESPLPGAQGITATTGTGDPEDKEALNYHILLIENMNHYVEEVHPKSNPVLEEWKARATHEMAEHMDWYLSAVIRRPLGKILDFLESTESLLPNASSGGSDPPSIALRASHSRSTFKKLLSAHDAREMRRGVETLRKRVEKHFGDADEAELSRALVAKVLRQCEAFYIGVRERLGRVITDVYEESVELDWKREDVITAFRR